MVPKIIPWKELSSSNTPINTENVANITYKKYLPL